MRHLDGLLNKLRPDAAPGFLAQRAPIKLPVGFVLDAPRLGRAHVAPAGQALIEVLLADAGRGGKLSPALGADFCRHIPECSDSLGACLAIRSGVTASGSLDNAVMETAGQRRKRKLADLCKQHGLEAVAAKAEVSVVYLQQILAGVKLPPKADGTRSERKLGDRAARMIEAAYNLGDGWFDTPEHQTDKALLVGHLNHDEEDLVLSFRKLPHALQDRLIRGLMKIALRHDSTASAELEKRNLMEAASDEAVGAILEEANTKMQAAKKAQRGRKAQVTGKGFNLGEPQPAKKRSVAK